MTFRRFADTAPADVQARLGVPPAGLTEADARTRLLRDGPNALATDGSPGPLTLFVRQFTSPLVGILVFAALVSLVAREWTDAGVVLGIVVLSALLSFTQEWRAARAVAELRTRIAPRSRVLRDGAWREVPSTELVSGDRVALAAGSLVPADAILIQSNDFMVDEAVLTGETFPVEKRSGPFSVDAPLGSCRSVVFAGTTVRSGVAEVLVVDVAMETELGRIASRLRTRAAETDFEHGVRRFGIMLSRVMLVLVGLVFVFDAITDKPPLDSLLFAIAIAVGIAPEMLPAVITITLAQGARRMATHGVIVRRLAAIENLGSMDVLCTDKTGTLTEGVVELERVLGPGGEDSARVLELAFTNSKLESGFTNPLDTALVAYGTQRQLSCDGVGKIAEVPYDFIRKRLGIVFVRGGERTLVVKGAFRQVLGICSAVRAEDTGAEGGLDEARRAELVAKADAHAAEGLRVLGVASRRVAVAEHYGKEDEVDLVFEGFLLFSDPPKVGIEAVLEGLRVLGITVKVITGDSRAAAAHLVSRVGLAGDQLLTSSDIAALSDEALPLVAERTTVFAEVDPNQKERIILALRRRGHCVGYMGDGINDAPALHAADVGISVSTAVEVAKESADFVLLEPDLGVLRAGVEEGRRTFANTLKYVYTTTSANFGNMLSMAAASAFLPFLPLLAKQVLLNNFLSDFPAMAIVGDGVDREDVLRPRRWDIDEIQRFMMVFGATSSVFDVLTFLFLSKIARVGAAGFRTGWFVESLLTELVIVFVVRTRRPFWKSRPSRALVLGSIAVALFAIALPYTPLAAVFELVPLPLTILLPLLTITLAYAGASEAVKRRLWRGAEERVA